MRYLDSTQVCILSQTLLIEVMAHEVFRLVRACLLEPGIVSVGIETKFTDFYVSISLILGVLPPDYDIRGIRFVRVGPVMEAPIPVPV